jgi:hypothetical protein
VFVGVDVQGVAARAAGGLAGGVQAGEALGQAAGPAVVVGEGGDSLQAFPAGQPGDGGAVEAGDEGVVLAAAWFRKLVDKGNTLRHKAASVPDITISL